MDKDKILKIKINTATLHINKLSGTDRHNPLFPGVEIASADDGFAEVISTMDDEDFSDNANDKPYILVTEYDDAE